MQIVIDIPNEDYKAIKNMSVVGDMTISYVFDGIRNGTPLPKRHGRLIDVDVFISKVKADRKHSAYSRSWTADDVLTALDNSYAPTIIEADKEKE